jgi:uncharacterized protein (TIGR03435 family)
MMIIPALANHLWQSTVFAAVIAVLTFVFRGNQARVRYWLWLTASLKFLVPFALLIALGNQLPWRSVQQLVPSAVSTEMLQVSQPFVDNAATIDLPVPTGPRQDFPWLLKTIISLWLIGAVLIAVVRLRLWLRIRMTIAGSAPCRLGHVEVPAGLTIRSAPGLLEPGVVGWLRPVLLVPADIAEHLTPRQLESVLAHEVCHIRRRDNLTAALQMVVESLFWFHPLVWWIGARLVVERERACDETVLSGFGDGQDYAEAILAVCRRYAETPLSCVAGVSSADLRKRLDAIIRNRVGVRLTAAKKAFLVAALALIFALPVLAGAFGQASPRPPFKAFEVATIKPASEEPGRWYKMKTPDRFEAHNHSVRTLLSAAYDLPPAAISGGPEWVNSDLWDILAKTPGTIRPRVDEQMSMLRQLLADRFKCTFHREQREFPIFALTLAPRGPKLKATTISPEATPTGPPLVAFVVAPGEVRLPARYTTMQEFASLLTRTSQVSERPVVDRTGLTDRYDFDLAFAPDDSLWAGGQYPRPGTTEKPPLFQAMQEQLGLKLEPTRGPIDVLVIDHAERPTPN